MEPASDMGTRLDVGNLPLTVDVKALRTWFGRHGRVLDVRIAEGGHAFVTMNTADDGARAVRALHGAKFGDRELSVTEAREQPRQDTGEADPPAALRVTRTVRDRCGITYVIERGATNLSLRMSPTDDGTGQPRWRIEVTWSRSPDLFVSAAAATRIEAFERVRRLWNEQQRPNGLPPVDWTALQRLLTLARAF